MKKGTAASNPHQPAAHDGDPLHRELPADSLRHLARSLASQWKRYRKKLKRCQEKFSEKAVHDSRVETRRLLSTVELLGAFIPQRRVKKAQRVLKEHLDTFSALRDAQVQLRYVGKMQRAFPAARPFYAYLVECEERFRWQTRRGIKRIKTWRLGQAIARCEEELRGRRKRTTPRQAQTAMLRALERAFGRVLRLRKRIDPKRTVTIHRTRIAFKKFRYMVELLASVLTGVTEERLAAMRQYQAMMGSIQDLEVLLAALDKFLKKNEVEARPARQFREELARKREWLIRRYLDNADKVRELWR